MDRGAWWLRSMELQRTEAAEHNRSEQSAGTQPLKSIFGGE